MSDIQLTQVPTFRRGFRFQWEPAQNCHVLLYPEGMVRLNGPASEILCCCDGQRSVKQVIRELQERFDKSDLHDDICNFVRHAYERGWIS